ncbi:MAG: recombinase RecT, partial [Clostridia bacterium]|nr:recombinase RecT [Clostridia bacterium]
WSREKMEQHAIRYSKGYAAKKGYTFWEKDFDAMAFKTMLRQLISKWGVMSIDLQKAFEADSTLEDAEFVQAAEISQPDVIDMPATDDNGEVIEGETVEEVDLNEI